MRNFKMIAVSFILFQHFRQQLRELTQMEMGLLT